MQYGQIVSILLACLLLYYVAMIVLDIHKARMAKTAEQEGHSEEEIDISDEAQNFKPVLVSRDGSAKGKAAQDENAGSGSDSSERHSNTEKPLRRPGYREAVMTDGILVENLLEEVNQLAETGTSDLGTVIYTCENAR